MHEPEVEGRRISWALSLAALQYEHHDSVNGESGEIGGQSCNPIRHTPVKPHGAKTLLDGASKRPFCKDCA